LISFPYRSYDIDAGRFLQRDPSGYIDSENLYEYVSGNVLSSTDELGLAGESFGKFLVTRLDELTKAGKINTDPFMAKMILEGGGNLGKIPVRIGAGWKSSLLNDPHRQLLTAASIYEMPDLEIRFKLGLMGRYPSQWQSFDPPVLFVSLEQNEASILATLDGQLGLAFEHWLSSRGNSDEIGSVMSMILEGRRPDYVKKFRTNVDIELFVTKGNIDQAVLDEMIPNSPNMFQMIVDVASARGITLTRTEAYGIARYLHDIAGSENLVHTSSIRLDKLTPTSPRERMDAFMLAMQSAESSPSQFFLSRFNDAIIEVKRPGWKIPFEDTLVPGPVTPARKSKIIDLLGKIENGR
jgi:hypothetical protein